MKKIVLFAGSNSTKSINKQLAIYASTRIKNVAVTVLDLNDYSLPIYGVDEEMSNGIPQQAKDFLEALHDADGIILSLAEHNGNFTVAFKNIFDWSSRIQQKLWNDIPMLLLATSPGGRGGASVLAIAQNGFPHMGGNISATFSLPAFTTNFVDGKIVDTALLTSFQKAVQEFENSL